MLATTTAVSQKIMPRNLAALANGRLASLLVELVAEDPHGLAVLILASIRADHIGHDRVQQRSWEGRKDKMLDG